MENKCSGSLGKYMIQLSPFNLQVPYSQDQSPFPVEGENPVIFD